MAKLTTAQKNKITMLTTVSAASAIIFFITFLILGFVQPGYSHVRDTISVLALGQWGLVQNINFVQLGIGLLAYGAWMGYVFAGTLKNPITYLMWLCAIGITLLAVANVDRLDATQIRLTSFSSFNGWLHFWITFSIVIAAPALVWFLVRAMKKNGKWKAHQGYTINMVLFNLVVGLLWFYCRKEGYFFDIKGLTQKILAVNSLIWIVVMSLHASGNVGKSTLHK